MKKWNVAHVKSNRSVSSSSNFHSRWFRRQRSQTVWFCWSVAWFILQERESRKFLGCGGFGFLFCCYFDLIAFVILGSVVL